MDHTESDAMKTKTASTIALLVALSGAASIAPNALAQAGGGGRILERDMRVGAGNSGLTARPNMMDEVRMRNALITGSAGGLRSFRGNVGYRGLDDFGSRLGSDSTYSFRRDSASATSLRGVDALRYQTSFSTGNNYGGINDYSSRIGATGAAAAAAAPGTADTSYSSRTGAFSSPRNGSLRSTAAFTANQTLNPTLLTFNKDATGATTRVTSSSLMGIRTLREQLVDRNIPIVEPRRTDAFGKDLIGANSALDKTTRERSPENKGMGLTPESLNTNLQGTPDNAENVPSDPNLQKPLSRSVYDDIRERMKKIDEEERTKKPVLVPPTTPDGGTTPSKDNLPTREQTLDDRIAKLRERLVPKESRLTDDKGRTFGSRTLTSKKDKDSDQTEDGKKNANKRDLTAEDLETIDIIRRAKMKAETFTDPATGKRDFFTEHMEKGQTLLGNGQYFDAEERFALALSIKQGDVSAQAARIHAQLGAGLYLSAALNLRNLFGEHPEVVGIRYANNTIPKVERLRSIAAELRGQIQASKDRKQDPLSADGLLLAYVGFQIEDATMAEEGLEVAKIGMHSTAEKQGVNTDQSQLIPMLEKVWLEKLPKK